MQNFLGTNTCDATWWPKLELMEVKIKEDDKLKSGWKKMRKSLRKTLPEAQRTQGIESVT